MLPLRFAPIVLLAVLTACSPAKEGGSSLPPIEWVTQLPRAGGEALLDFGVATLGETRERRIVLRNGGRREAALEALALDPPFSAMVDGASTLAPGEERTIVLRFTASEEAPRETRVQLAEGIRLHLTGAGAPCTFSLDLDSIDFGTSQIGLPSERQVTIRNEGEAACTLEAAAVEGDSAFSVLPPAKIVIRPGTRYALPVRFRPMAEGTQQGSLRLVVSGSEATVALRGETGETCFRTEVAELDFGTVGMGCGGASQVLQVLNECGASVLLEQVVLEPADQPFRIWAGTPRPIDAGSTTWISLAFEPQDDLEHRAALRLLGSDGVLLASADLVGTGGSPITPTQDSYFVQNKPPLDVLVVVDDSEAMDAFQSRLQPFASGLVELLRGRDFRLAVTGTSSVGTGDCPALGGTLIGSEEAPAILEPTVGGWGDHLLARLRPARCHPAADSAGLEAAWRAVGAEDAPFATRSDSWLWLIFLVPGEEHSPEEPSVYADRFESLMARETQLPWLVAEGWIGPADCSLASDTSRWTSFLARFGGSEHGVCRGPSWEQPQIPFGPAQRTYWVTNWPADVDGDGAITEASGEITLLVDDVPVPQVGENGLQWAFQTATASVDLLMPLVPQHGETLTLDYKTFCGDIDF